MSNAKQTTWETYVGAWREASAEGKAAALARSAAPECLYQDPLTAAKGHRELIDYMLEFHRQVPGGHFVTTQFLAHHDSSMARWNMVDRAGAVIGDGVSFGRYDEQGALVAMTGFFQAPA